MRVVGFWLFLLIVVVATLAKLERGLAMGVLATIVAVAACVTVAVLWSRWGRRLSAGGRKRRRRTLYAVVILLSVGWAAANGLGSVLAQWGNGGSTEEVRLGFTTMLWWGRIGKGLQFAAGLVVLIDLADPDRLREAGKRARLRQRGIDPRIAERRSTDTNLRMAAWLHEHIVTRPLLVGPPIGGVQHAQHGDPVLVDAESVVDVPDEAPFSLLDHRVLHARFSGEVDGRAITSEDEKRLYAMVWELMTERLTAGEAARLHRTRRWRSMGRTALLAGFFLFFGAVLVSAYAQVYLGDWFTLASGVIAVAIVAVLSQGEGELYERWLHAVHLPARVVTEGLARLLDRERPAHPLRWFGLFLFVYGFALDLLAS
ncbi:hypothetical protein ACBJ59_00355 [Nonomuraea sp. MTCD27]|uniref:hypothetical protein n=1 Tax=Nonomuraea sp. MTCD27 TaxID=1676747 RepID=UPI0035BFAC01